jgi:hypothetical protein
MESLLDYFPSIKGLWLTILFFGILPVLGVVLGVAVLMGIGKYADDGSSRVGKRVALVTILLVLVLAIAFIVYYVMYEMK